MKRAYWTKQSRQENIIYLVVWGVLFAAPVLSLYVRTVNDTSLEFDWTEVFVIWRKFAVYLFLFLLHNFLLAPLLVYGRKRVAYFSIMAVILAAFTVFQCSSRPEGWERRGHRPNRMEHQGGHQPPTGFDGKRPPLDFEDGRPPKPDKEPPRKLRNDMPPPIIGERDILAVVMLVLMLGANLGIKGYFRGSDDRRRLTELERQNLEQQLEYLRYQINPHFFMNTLNNIHALVDIDPEKAKDTIRELSTMMRFLLYEGNKELVPLTRELDFIRHYVTLMRLRYTDKVGITVDLPEEVPERQVPPLMLITFIENAFKHGVTYQRESFIDVKVMVDGDRLSFLCRNSKSDKPNEEKGGVGLANVRKRLNLLYDKDYTLRVKDEADTYTVELNIPLS